MVEGILEGGSCSPVISRQAESRQISVQMSRQCIQGGLLLSHSALMDDL